MKLNFLTAKQVSLYTDCSLSTANNIIKDIKTQNNIKTRITEQHLLNYLGL
jgi:hypothetical protein